MNHISDIANRRVARLESRALGKLLVSHGFGAAYGEPWSCSRFHLRKELVPTPLGKKREESTQ